MFGLPWNSIIEIDDPTDFLIAQAGLAAAEASLDRILDQLAVKIRNQIADAFSQR